MKEFYLTFQFVEIIYFFQIFVIVLLIFNYFTFPTQRRKCQQNIKITKNIPITFKFTSNQQNKKILNHPQPFNLVKIFKIGIQNNSQLKQIQIKKSNNNRDIKKKNITIVINMNRSYFLQQQIDCSCFNLQNQFSFINTPHLNTQCQLNPSQQIKMQYINNHHLSTNSKILSKKSLKRRKCLQINHHQINGKDHQGITPKSKYISQHSQCVHKQQKKNKSVYFMNKNYHQQFYQHQHRYASQMEQSDKQNHLPVNVITVIPPRQQNKGVRSKVNFNEILKKTTTQKNIQSSKLNHSQIIDKNMKQNSNKKKQPLIVNFENVPQFITLTYLDNQTKKQIQLSQRKKRSSLNSQNLIISFKKLKKMHPKLIQSYNQYSQSGYQSEVLQHGKFTYTHNIFMEQKPTAI